MKTIEIELTDSQKEMLDELQKATDEKIIKNDLNSAVAQAIRKGYMQLQDQKQQEKNKKK